jgi:Tol biopolymer transport system component
VKKKYWLVPLVVWLGLALWLAIQPRPAARTPELPPAEIHPTISFDGQWVAFETSRPDEGAAQKSAFGRRRSAETDVAIVDRRSSQVRRLSAPKGSYRFPYLSGDGEMLVLEGTDGETHQSDIFLVHRRDLRMEHIKVPWRTSGKANCFMPAISSDGSTISFLTYRPDPSGPWVKALGLVRTTDLSRVETPNDEESSMPSWRVSISPDGKRVAWERRTLSDSGELSIQLFVMLDGGKPVMLVDGGAEPVVSNSACAFLAPDSKGIYQIVLHDFSTGASRALTNGNDDCLEPSISDDGKRIVFTSYATNLTQHDQNGTSDVFLYDVDKGTTTCLSQNGDGASYNPSVSGNGRAVVFASWATNLASQPREPGNVYIWEQGWTSCQVLPF